MRIPKPGFLFLSFAALGSVHLSIAASAADDCRFPVEPKVIRNTHSELHQYWTFKDTSNLWSTTVTVAQDLKLYRDVILSSGIPIDQNATLARQKRYFLSRPELGLQAEAKNMELALAGQVERVRPIDCLETLLFREFLRALDGRAAGSEFIGYILRKTRGHETLLRVYFSTASDLKLLNQSQRNLVFPGPIEPDLRDGWVLEAHIHNHSFFAGWTENSDQSRDWGGGVSPGLSDVGLYRNFALDYGLRSSRITNGFHTGEIQADGFQVFRTHGEQ